MASDSRFPTELYDHIIDQLLRDNSSTPGPRRRALVNCLSVSKSFRHRARTHLFSTLRVDDGKTHWFFDETRETHDRLKLLVDLMRPPVLANQADESDQVPGDPYAQGILPYIHLFHFQFLFDGLFTSSNNGRSELSSRALEYCTDILEMLATPACTLKVMHIKSIGYHYGSWGTLASPLRSALLKLLRVAPMQLDLSRITELSQNILRSTMITDLFISDADLFELNPDSSVDLEVFPEYEEESGMALLPLPDLKHANIGELFDEFCHQMFPTDEKGHRASIQNFNVCLEELENVEESLQRISMEFPNLETLYLNINCKGFDSDIDEFDFRGMVSLKELIIDFQSYGFLRGQKCTDALPKMLPWIISFLKFCSNPTVSTISLLLPTMVYGLTSDGSFDLDLKLFSDLDSLLNSSSVFPSFQRCAIRLFVRDVPSYHGKYKVEVSPKIGVQYDIFPSQLFA